MLDLKVSIERDGAQCIASGSMTLANFLLNNSTVEFIRFQWTDYSSRLRVKIATIDYARQIARNHSKACLTAGLQSLHILVDNSTIPGSSECGINELWPDWATLRNCPHYPAHASVICSVRHKGDRFEHCPRQTLKNIVENAAREQHVTLRVGLEIEIALFEGWPDALKPLKGTPGAATAAALRSPYLPVLEDIIRALQRSHIPVQDWHSEAQANGMPCPLTCF